VYCIGLTGNIASGKSTAATYFAALGIDVISADEIAKELTAKTQPACIAIVNHFGKSALTAEGELNRPYIRQQIFNDTSKRLWLEQLLHPLIRKQIESRIGRSTSPYCLIEIPLLSDRLNYPYLNRILLIQAEQNQQIERYIKRDKGSKEEAIAILAAQQERNQHVLADDVLMNTGTLTELQDKIDAFHTKYLYFAQPE